jgi:hypothetical protein
MDSVDYDVCANGELCHIGQWKSGGADFLNRGIFTLSLSYLCRNSQFPLGSCGPKRDFDKRSDIQERTPSKSHFFVDDNLLFYKANKRHW